jgi:hypothetical protein
MDINGEIRNTKMLTLRNWKILRGNLSKLPEA